LQGDDEAARDETRATMAWALDQCLKLLHPIMPFVTEELWGQIAAREGLLIHADWPELPLDLADPAADAEMGWVIKVIEGVRSVRAEMNVPGGAQIPLNFVNINSQDVGEYLSRSVPLIERLGRVVVNIMTESAETAADTEVERQMILEAEYKGSTMLPNVFGCEAYLRVKGFIDVAAERARLSKALDKVTKEIGGLRSKLANEKFLAKAPEHVVAEQHERLNGAEAEREKMAAALARLSDLA